MENTFSPITVIWIAGLILTCFIPLAIAFSLWALFAYHFFLAVLQDARAKKGTSTK